jgi:hypothetical protein
MRYLILYLLLAGLLLGSVSAADGFTTTLRSEKDSIYADEVALASLTITNTGTDVDRYSVSTPDFDWILDTTDPVLEVAPGQTKTFYLEFVPKSDVAPGPHAVRVKVRSSATKEFETLSILVSVRSLEGANRTYTPAIFLSARIPESIDPREGITASVYLRNRNARVYDKLTVLIESDLFRKEYTTSLGPIGDEGEKTNQVPIVLDAHTPPGTHPVTVTVFVGDAAVNKYETQFTVKAYDATNQEAASQTKFFKTVTVYTLENNGNIRQVEDIQHPTSFFKRLFTSASADYGIEKTADGSALIFSVNLEPQQRSEVTVTENYRLLFILAVILVISIISYYLLRSPVVLRKEAIIYGGSTDGVSHIKIRLYIRNRSGKSLHNLHVIDRVTSMADVVKETALGTLHPTRIIRKKGHGTLVRWDIDSLEPFEERIITYHVATQLKLIGDVYLPAMKVKFDQAGRERTTYSNEVNIPREG